MIFFQMYFANGIPVIATTNNMTQDSLSTKTGGRLKNPPNNSFETLTICWRFKNFLRNDPVILHSLVSLTNNTTTDGENEYAELQLSDLRWSHDKYRQFFTFFGETSFLDLDWKPMRWHHTCFAYDSMNGTYRIVDDGKVVLTRVHKGFL